jgi:Ca2+-transporting ATPase
MTREATPTEAGTAWHTLSRDAVAGALSCDPEAGLGPDAVRSRLSRVGPNRLPSVPPVSRWTVLFRQLESPVIAVLFAAAALSAAIGDPGDAAAIAVVLVLNAALGYAHERGAERALSALRRLEARRATVRREGRTAVVPAEDLVPGDVVLLEAGERVPADLRLVRGESLQTVEAALTGESAYVDKDPAARLVADTPLPDRRTMAYAGTTLAAGVGEGLVVATGGETELGRIVAMTGGVREEPTPLQSELARLARLLLLVSAGAVLLIFVTGLIRGLPFSQMLPAAVGLAVAAVPEGLPAVVTIALAVAVRRMARRNALIRRLPAVETLGSASVICVDKTGTLTTGRMEATTVATLDGESPAATASSIEVLRAAACCCTATLVSGGTEREVRGDPMEGAILLAAEKAGIAPCEDRPLAIHPFDAGRKRMSVLRHGERGEGATLFVKGAPETVIPSCARAWRGGREVEVDESTAGSLRELNAGLARRGLRVLAVARRRGLHGEAGAESLEVDLVFLGFLGLEDPARPDTPSAVRACRDAGIRTVMITGDQAGTALAVARDLGIAQDPEEVESGAALEGMSEEELDERARVASVYARTSPAQKLRIVRALRRGGDVAAMTGDGVNDAPALKAADIGIAMGSGTDVAKDVADMVVTDDRFSSIVAAVSEGRAVHENVRKSLLYVLSGNVGELLVIATALVVGWPLPLLPLQILWINLVTDSLPALALAIDPPHVDLLRRPPRARRQAMADGEFLRHVLRMGVLTAACTLGAFAYGLASGTEDRARTLAFSTLVVAEALRAFVVRSRIRIIWELGLASNLRLLVIGLLILGVQGTLTLHPSWGSWLGIVPLEWPDALVVGGLGLVPATIIEVRKLVRRALRHASASLAS